MKIALLFVCLAFAGCDQLRSDSTETDSDHFQLAVDSKGDAWVLDIRTGETKKCWQGSAGTSPPTCYVAVQK